MCCRDRTELELPRVTSYFLQSFIHHPEGNRYSCSRTWTCAYSDRIKNRPNGTSSKYVLSPLYRENFLDLGFIKSTQAATTLVSKPSRWVYQWRVENDGVPLRVARLSQRPYYISQPDATYYQRLLWVRLDQHHFHRFTSPSAFLLLVPSSYYA